MKEMEKIMKSKEDVTITEAKKPIKTTFSKIVNTIGQKMLINLAALIFLMVILLIFQNRFFTIVNITNVLRQISGVIIVSSAVTLLMVAGCLDLSVGGVVALSGVTGALLSKVIPLPLALIIATGVGTLVGALNGILFTKIGINAFIATLGTMYVCQGAANLLTDGTAVIMLPDAYSILGTGYLLGIPIPVWLAIAAIAIFLFLEKRTLLGKYSVAAGSNKQAAFLCGIPVNKVQMVLYILCGTMAGFQGVLLSSRLGVGLPSVGIGFEFQVIVATILGGTSLAGGEGSVIGMVVGAIIVGVLNNGMNLLSISSFWQTVALGVVLVLAVALDSSIRKQRVRTQRKTENAPEVQASK